ncbi:putative REM2- and Rab-like small GTPase 1 [Apostichopus japonicus]|uniref:Ciliogenesis and planar polarity effector 2 n=1 Tax=Stichopus japonicus TaxID=307972 RepID=A0A2G8L3P6_STIJA|nr:putative REM2- and Rab-like small GTPase 1 [Apostichopus japonicus]
MSVGSSSESLILPDWYKSKDGKPYINAIFKGGKRKVFGFLERPALPPQITPEMWNFKARLVGKSGVGKTSTVAKLTGQPAPRSHCETPGIVSSVAYWPIKLNSNGNVILTRLQFWDAGDNVGKKYDHIYPACREDIDVTLFLFSYTDRSSFLDLHKKLSDSEDDLKDTLRVIVGTKFDQIYRSEITSKELEDFQRQWMVPLLSVQNVHKTETDSGRIVTETCNDLKDVAPSLNRLCEFLLAFRMIKKGLLKDYAWVRTESRSEDDDADSDIEATYV